MKELEVSGKTVDEATQVALEQLGASEDQVEVTVLKKGRSGVLGMGAAEARIKVRLLPVPGEKAEKGEKGDVVKVAKEVAEALIKSMRITADVSVTQSATGELPVTLNIDGDDLGVLIGRRGQTLVSLQYVVRLIVAEKLKMWVPINVDVAGYKNRRYESLQSLALRLAEQVQRNRRLIMLEPMPADERRIIHLALADHPDVTTQSMGEGEMRKVAILLKKH
ncbi:MAG: protein jag [Chloroflexi bacterium]|nr:protein jag [Chloroflexota bacterium]MBL7061374.1 protein jag [Dehalococcoidia bacterium]